MTREEKIKLLRSVSQGKTIDDALPKKEIWLIEATKGVFIDPDNCKCISIDEMNIYREQCEKVNATHRIHIKTINHEEFKIIEKDLEQTY